MTAVYSQNHLIKATIAGWRVDRRPGATHPRCDCGRPATAEVIIQQLMCSQEPMNNALVLCDDCLTDFYQIEQPLAVYPLQRPEDQRHEQHLEH